ncbi:MAG: methionine--tRNA ligase subunit beta [Candidatus Bathyarchaeia archaeon]|nr:methionine--tRNA ligase subunit beta [Candidatus Bathyarchaeota archaeon]
MNQADITDFQKLDLRVGTVTSVERVEGTKKLYKILVDLGELGVKQTISGLVGYYTPEELKGKKVVFLANLKPAKIAGIISEGMLLAAVAENTVSLLSIDKDVPNGTKIS